jgi:16S rRNA processing protein RimM
MPGENCIAIGIVKRPVGLKGFCAIESFGDTVALLHPPCTVLLGKDIAHAEGVVIEEIVSLPNGFRCRFNGRNDLTAVEGLRGSVIFIEEEVLPELRGNVFYQFELKGMAVYSNTENKPIGTITEVHNFPSVDTIEIERTAGGSLLIPLINEAVVAIDKAGRRITVRQSFVEELLF